MFFTDAPLPNDYLLAITCLSINYAQKLNIKKYITVYYLLYFCIFFQFSSCSILIIFLCSVCGTVQKHLSVYLDEKLNFNTHITEKIGKISKGIRVIPYSQSIWD